VIPILAAILAILAPAPAKATATLWTWSLYEKPATATFAHEVPDTDKLSEVVECVRATGEVKVSIYPGGDVKSAEKFVVPMTVRDPGFQSFLKSGRLVVSQGDHAANVAVAGKDMLTLAKFAKSCGA
jgi:hypothetical protein